LRLRVGRACLQNSDAALFCGAQPLLPESGLADPWFALQQQRLTARGDIRQKRFEREQLFAPADDLNWHGTLLAGPQIVHVVWYAYKTPIAGVAA
jgi:hypothetical protein